MSKYSGDGMLVQFVTSFPIEAAYLIDKLQTKVKELEQALQSADTETHNQTEGE